MSSFAASPVRGCGQRVRDPSSDHVDRPDTSERRPRPPRHVCGPACAPKRCRAAARRAIPTSDACLTAAEQSPRRSGSAARPERPPTPPTVTARPATAESTRCARSVQQRPPMEASRDRETFRCPQHRAAHCAGPTASVRSCGLSLFARRLSLRDARLYALRCPPPPLTSRSLRQAVESIHQQHVSGRAGQRQLRWFRA